MFRAPGAIVASLLMAFNVIGNLPLLVNEIQFVFDEDCLIEGFVLSLVDEYSSYQWEDANDASIELGTSSSISINYSSNYCVTVIDDMGVSCTACVDIQLMDLPYPVITGATACQFNIGIGNTHVDFISLILDGPTDGTWFDIDGSGVDLSDLSYVDFEGIPFGSYDFGYEIEISDCGYIISNTISIEVVECACPIINLAPLGEYCNEGALNLGDFSTNYEGEWSSNDFDINDDILQLDGIAPGQYNLTFNWLEIDPDCQSLFDTTIEIIGCFQAGQVLSVDEKADQLIFSWTDELEALDLEIVVLQGPEGVRDGNTFTMSGLSLGEEGGIEIFVNTEGYLYDNDLVIFGQTILTSVSDQEIQESTVKLYPNPVSDYLVIEELSNSSKISSVFIYSTTKKDINLSMDVKNNTIDVSHLLNGLYMTVIEINKEIVHLPFIKM